MLIKNIQNNFYCSPYCKNACKSTFSFKSEIEKPARKNDTLEVLYINDWHRKFSPLFSLSRKIDEFDNEKTANTDKLKIAAGDLVVGENQTINKFFFKFFSNNGEKNNKPAGLGFDVMCLGNHEFDPGEEGLANELDDNTFPTYPFVATNLTIKDSSPLARYRDNKIVKSYIKEINGTPYGFVGLVPTTLNGGKYSATFFPGVFVADQRVDSKNQYIFIDRDNEKYPVIQLKKKINGIFNQITELYKTNNMDVRKSKLLAIFEKIKIIYKENKKNNGLIAQNESLKNIIEVFNEELPSLEKATNHTDKKEKIRRIVDLTVKELSLLEEENTQKMLEMSLNETIQILNKEVSNFEKDGINRIICISHMGPEENEIIARNVSGIDIIVSGHKHDLYNKPKIEYRKRKTTEGQIDEPTIIVQAGRNGEHIGKLKVKFDPKGVIDTGSIMNEVKDNWLESIFDEIKRFYDEIDIQLYGEKAIELGNLVKPYYPIMNKIQENPVLSFVADAMRFESKADAVLLLNQYDYRNIHLNKGIVTERDIEDLATYDDNICLVKLTGSDIEKILNCGVESLNSYNGKQKTGTVQVSGLKYTISPQKVSDIYITSGVKEIPLEADKVYKVVTNPYFMKRANETENYDIYNLIKLSNLEKLPYRTKFAVVDYMYKNKDKFSEFTLEPTGRIKVVDYKFNG